MSSAVPFGAHALLVAMDRNIILQQKTLAYSFNSLNSGKLSVFGGGPELGEIPLDALRRELNEELRLEVSNEEIKNYNAYKKNQA